MNIRIYNCRILTMDSSLDIIEGEVWTADNRIDFVGTNEEAKMKLVAGTKNFDREIDGKNNLLMPGFKNAHTHSAMTFLRSFADDLPLSDWLYKSVFPREDKLIGEDVYYFSKLAILEYLSSGITCNFDMYMYPDDGTQASIDSGFRTVLCGRVNDFGGTVESLHEEFDRFNKLNELISYRLGFHAEYTTARPLIEGIAKLANELKEPVFLHNSETEDEVAGCIERYKTTPTVFLDSIGMFEYGGGGFHCVHLSDEDIEVMKKRKLSAVTNPCSNAKLASGVAPLERLLKEGICVGIGTDGPASNNSLDFFKEMYLAISMQKLKNKDAASMDANEVLRMAAVNGASIMGIPECECIRTGMLADMILIDMNRPNMQPENNITKNLVYSGSKENIKMTMVNGRILYEDGNFFIGESPEDIYRKVKESLTSGRYTL